MSILDDEDMDYVILKGTDQQVVPIHMLDNGRVFCRIRTLDHDGWRNYTYNSYAIADIKDAPASVEQSLGVELKPQTTEVFDDLGIL